MGKRKGAPKYNRPKHNEGRVKGQKNLQKFDGGVINQHGIMFTDDEKKALEQAVNTANRKRKRMLKEWGGLERKYGGQPTGETIGGLNSLSSLQKESDFILRPKSKSLQRFETREAFEAYLKNVQRVNQRNYIDIRVQQYKDNYIAGLRNAFGADADEIIEQIKKMKPKEYMRKVEADETLEIGYLYEKDAYHVKLNHIRHAVGLEGIDW